MEDYYSQLLNYVKQSYAHGYSEDAIRTLLANGYVTPELVEKVITTVKAEQKIPVPVSQTPLFVAAARLGTISVVAAVVFLVRTTGALQQVPAAIPTDTPQPVVAKIEDTPSPSATPSETPSSSPSATPSPSSVPSMSIAPPAASNRSVLQAPAPVKSVAPPPPAPVYTYKNGTYSAIGSFSTPAGTEKISITISVTNDVVTSTSATDMANNRTSSNYNGIFIANYKSLVVGQSLKSLSLGRVSSASLTPNGFNNAVASIRNQAA